MVDGEYETRIFSCEEDVWDVVDLIIGETKEMNETTGKSFEVSGSVKSQLPFLACNNILLDKEFQKDIERYIYCENFKTPAYSGGYDDQPALWVQKSFIIKKAVNKMQNKAVENGK